jgi:hypothetical protein
MQVQLQTLLYLIEFEQISMSHAMKDFQKCDKHSLARSIWLSHRDNITALRLICRLCVDYDIVDPTLLENALKAILALKDIDFLLEIFQSFFVKNMDIHNEKIDSLWIETLQLSLFEWFEKGIQY